MIISSIRNYLLDERHIHLFFAVTLCVKLTERGHINQRTDQSQQRLLLRSISLTDEAG